MPHNVVALGCRRICIVCLRELGICWFRQLCQLCMHCSLHSAFCYCRGCFCWLDRYRQFLGAFLQFFDCWDCSSAWHLPATACIHDTPMWTPENGPTESDEILISMKVGTFNCRVASFLDSWIIIPWNVWSQFDLLHNCPLAALKVPQRVSIHVFMLLLFTLIVVYILPVAWKMI